MLLRLRSIALPRRRRPTRPLASGPITLEIARGRVNRRMRPVQGPVFLVGSATDCDLVLGDPRFPDAYAYIYQRPEGVTIRYLGAGPVLEVDGRTSETSPLVAGSRIIAGPFEFIVHVGGNDYSGGDDDEDYSSTVGENSAEEYDAAADVVRALLAEIRRKVLEPTVIQVTMPRRASA